MATRFYFPSSGAAAVTPVNNGSWASEASTHGDYRMVHTTPSGTAMTTDSPSVSAFSSPVFRTYVSDPIQAQTISAGTFKAQFRVQGHSTAGGSRMEMYVVSNDGSTVRGTLVSVAQYGTGSVFETAQLENLTFANSDGYSAVTASEGDRIVIRIGVTYYDVGGIVSISFGDDSGTDLGENQTDTSAFNPWVEFSGDIEFQATQGTAHAAAGASDAVSSLSGTAAVAVPAAGASVSSLSGTAAAAGQLDAAGSSDAVSSLSGTAAVAVTAAGSSDAVSSLSGTASSGRQEAASGTSAGGSSVSGSATVALSASGSSAGSSDVAGSAALAVSIVGGADASSSVSGALALSAAIQGALAGASLLTGTASRTTFEPFVPPGRLEIEPHRATIHLDTRGSTAAVVSGAVTLEVLNGG